MATLEQWIECRTADGKPLPRKKCNAYRSNRGLPPLETYASGQVVREPGTTPRATPKRTCKPRGKVGNELTALLKSVGIDSKWCETGCSGYSAQMNTWGVDGCRKRRAEIVARLESEQRKAGWMVTAKAAATALASGLAFELNPLDPLGSLVDLAIRRAEESLCGCETV